MIIPIGQGRALPLLGQTMTSFTGSVVEDATLEYIFDSDPAPLRGLRGNRVLQVNISATSSLTTAYDGALEVAFNDFEDSEVR